ncbi:MAG: hypothetical protein GX489_05530 [Firmicutes bacterium]|jgi:hypothetical protein|nr:hypothetical protein [Bacillota bacterium]
MEKQYLLPDVLAWPLNKAITELKHADVMVDIKEAVLPNRPVEGSELRVARVRADKEKVELVVVKAQTQPVGNMPPV